jgi:hypothetical protein
MAVTEALPDVGASPRATAARPRPPLAFEMLLTLALVVVAAHALTNLFGPYGFQRDEFLYFAMGRHLRLWGMDFPPAIALLSEAIRRLGDSMVVTRLVPALAHGLLVILAGMLARNFGGGRFAQALAAVSVAITSLFLRAGNLFQPVVLDQLTWTLALLALTRICRSAEEDGGTGDPVAWLGLGIAAGLGLLTKFSIGFLAVGMFVGLLLSPQRRVLLTRWPLEAMLLGLLIGSPSIVGQVRLGFPVVGQMRDLQSYQLVHVGYSVYLIDQLMMFGPVILLAIFGVLHLLLGRSARGFRAVAWTCLATFALLLALHGKAYYIGPIYPTLIAAGAAALELWTGAMAGRAVGRVTGNVLRGLVFVAVLGYGIGGLPMGLPILAPSDMARYAAEIGMAPALRTNTGEHLRLPQDYADMIGWPEEVAAVARAYKALPPDKQAQAVIIGSSYGHAGAIDYYGKRYGLPPAIAPVGSYWFWGPGDKPGNVAVVLGSDSAGLARYFRVVRPIGRMVNPWGVPEEQHAGIFVVEQPYKTLQQGWPSLKGRN